MDVADDGFFEALDDALRNDGVPIPLRPLAVMARLSKHLNSPISLEDDVATDVTRWFASRYGSRANVGSMGRVPLLVRGEMFVGRIMPMFKIISGTPTHSFEWWLEGGGDLRSDLAATEIADVSDMIQTGFLCYSELNSLFVERALAEAATVDIDTAIDELVRSEGPRPAGSKWASLQLAEKSMKAALDAHAVTYRYTHNLSTLNRQCADAGIVDFTKLDLHGKSILEHAQCNPGARYGEINVTLAEAMDAFYSALMIATGIAGILRTRAGGKRWLDMRPEDAAIFVTKQFAVRAGVALVVET